MITEKKQRFYLKAEAIYRFLTEEVEDLDKIILCHDGQSKLVTTDQSLYEAIASIEDKTKINLHKLTKFLEVVEVGAFRKMLGEKRSILSPKRAEEIRALVANPKKAKEIKENKQEQLKEKQNVQENTQTTQNIKQDSKKQE